MVQPPPSLSLFAETIHENKYASFERQNRREATLYRIKKENLTRNIGNQASV